MLTVDDYKAGSNALFRLLKSRVSMMAGRGESPFVDQAEAERRAQICAGCKFNIKVEENCGAGCAAIRKEVEKLARGFATKFTKLIGGKRTKWDHQLHVCRICRCENKAKIHYAAGILKAVTKPEGQRALPNHCYIAQELKTT